MSPTLVKVLVATGAVVVLVALGLIIYNQHEMKTQQLAIQTQMVQQQQLVDGIVRSQSQWANKDDLAKFASDNGLNLKAIQDNLGQLNSQLSSINVIGANSSGQNASNIPSSGTGPSNPNPVVPVVVPCVNGQATCPNTDTFGYQQKQQNLNLNEDFGNLKVPFGTVGFSAWQKDPWSVSIQPREYNVDTAVGIDDKERQTFYNKFTVKVGDKEYDIPIKNASTKQQYPSPVWSWWNPRLLLGLDGGLNITHLQGEFAPSINVGIMSYGQFKTTPDWSILEVGLGYAAVNRTAAVVITPAAYNIGRNLFSPLMNNTYLGPSLMINTDGSIGAGGGVRVGF